MDIREVTLSQIERKGGTRFKYPNTYGFSPKTCGYADLNVIHIIFSYESIIGIKTSKGLYFNKKYEGYSNTTSRHITRIQGYYNMSGRYIGSDLFEAVLDLFEEPALET